MSPENLLAAALFIPVLGALAIAACDRWPDLRETATLITAAALMLCVLALLGPVLSGAQPSLTLVRMLPGISLSLRIEPLGMLFALVASILWVVNSLYSIGYMRANKEEHQTRFYVCFALALACTMGIAFSANLLTLYLFYEGLTLITYPLVTHHGDGEARHGGRLYLGLLLGTSIVLLLPALGITWALTGTLEFVRGGILGQGVSNAAIGGLLALYMFGIGKAALMPFHRWLPAAMVAPTPVSALLHAVAVVKAGVFCVVKVIVYVFGVDALAGDGAGAGWLVWLAGFTIVAASVVALAADNLKRRLAYSTVSQLSYVVMAAALLAPLSVVGAVMHIAAHAVGKITLFFAAGAIYTAAHKTEVSQLGGIGRRMPWTMGAFTVGALSLIGVPPAVGFVSKWFIFQGAAATGHYLVMTVLGVSALLNAAYFLPIVHAAFFRPAPAGSDHGEAPLPMLLALLATATLTVVLFFYPQIPLALARQLAGI